MSTTTIPRPSDVTAEPSNTITVDADLRRRLTALSRCASGDGARPTLGCVHFDGDYVFATDLYVLGLVQLPGMVSCKVGVDAKQLAAALKGRKHSDATLTFAPDALTVRVDSTTTVLEYGDGTPPRVWDLVDATRGYASESPDAPVPAFNAAWLAKLAELAPEVGGERRPQVRLLAAPDRALKPVRVESLVAGQLLGLLMPIRAS